MERYIKQYTTQAYCSNCLETTGKKFLLIASIFPCGSSIFVALGQLECPNCFLTTQISSDTIQVLKGSYSLSTTLNAWKNYE